MQTRPSTAQRLLALVQDILCLPGKITAWLILPLILAIVLSVVAAQMGWSTFAGWSEELPVLGRALTVNSLFDLQWYIFALLVLFGGIWSFFEDRHVTVDTIAIKLSARTRALIAILGDLFLLLPFCALLVVYGWKFFAIAWRTGEGSQQGGLTAHWLIKGALPVAFALLALAGLIRIARSVGGLRRPRSQEGDVHHVD